MKNFVDTYEVLFDDKFKPLFGRIDFCEANTTTPKAVYSIDGVSLGSTVYINGKSSVQIMLDDSDYTAYYYRYIGDSDMTVDDNEESWLHFKTALIKEQNINITYDLPFRTVNTIDELRALEDMSNGDLVYVFGYEEKGDIAPRIFKWIENSPGSTDDGGYYIKSTSITSGVWIWIVEGDLIDVRYFGAFPNSTSTDTNCQLGKIANATHIANQLNKNLYFPSCSNGATGYYLFDGSNTLSLEKDIICDEVRFVVKEGTSGTSISCHELHKCTPRLFTKAGSESDPTVHIGNYTLKCDWSKASWFYGYSPANARIGYIIDQENVPGNYSNTNIKLIGQRRLVVGTHIYSGTKFSNCKFLETTYGLDNNVEFNNMEIKQEWFDLDYDFDDLTIGTNVEILLDNFKSTSLYLELKQRANQYDFGDLKEKTISSNLTLGASNANCIMENFVIQEGHSISLIGNWELHNGTGTINVDSNTTVNAIDCWLSTTSTVMNSLEMRRGALNGTGSLQLLSVAYFDNVDINKDLYLMGLNANFIGCNITSIITGTNLNLVNNIITNKVESRPEDNNFNFTLSNNLFTIKNDTVGYHHITTNASAGATRTCNIKGSWICNNCTYDNAHWIQVRQHGILMTGNTCKYINNAEPYFDKKNKDYIQFYGICINVNTDHADKSRIRTDIPLLMINRATTAIHLGNFKIYGFCLDRTLDARRVQMYCTSPNVYTLSDSGEDPNKLEFNSYEYGYITTVSETADYLNYEFTNYELSQLTDSEHKYLLGNESGYLSSNNLGIFTNSLSQWMNNDSQGRPMAKKDIKFTVLQDFI